MAALMWRACGSQQQWSRLVGCASVRYIRVRSLRTNGRKLHAASTNLAVKIRPLYILLGTSGGYAGYKQYESYKDSRLQKLGIEVPPKLAQTWEATSASLRFDYEVI